MTKRLFAMLLVMVMVLSMMPTSVWAEGTQPRAAHTHKVCNGSALCASCAHTDVTYEPLTDVSKLSTTSGNYYLTEDLVLTSQINIAANLDIKLCLNGFNIRAASGKNIRFFNINNSNVKLTVSNCGEKKNEAGVQKGVVTGAKDAIVFAGNNSAGSQIAFYNVIFDNNTGVGAAGTGSNSTMQLNSTASLTAVGCDFTNNYSNNAGVLRMYSTGTLNLAGCSLTGNRGKNGYALYLNKGTVTLTDTVIEGNYAYSADGANNGAVYITADATVNFTVQGKTKIWGNSNKITTDGTGQARDLAFKNVSARQPKVKIGAKGLADDAKIGIFLQSERLAADPYITGALAGKVYTKNFAANNDGYQIFTESDKLVMKEAVVEGHTHKICNGDTACASCAHTNVTYLPWGDPAKGEDKKLPTSGNYYLTTDVELSAQTDMSGTTLNLCLNGHTIKTASGVSIRHFMLANNAKLTISNCDAVNEGILTGGKASSLMTNSNAANESVIELYNVVLKGNSYSGGGAVMLQGKSNLKAVSSKFIDNAGTSSAGAMRLYGTGSATLINCEVKGNKAPMMTAIRQDNGHLILIDTVIEDNTATNAGDATYGAVYMTNSNTRTLTVVGETRITGNTDKDGKPVNVFFQNSAGKQGVITVGADGLSGNALIGVSLQKARLSAADGMAITAKLNGANPVAHFASDNAAYVPVVKDDVVILGNVEAYTHKHKICADSTCADHADVTFQPWGDTDEQKTSLPATGSYFLTSDVTLSAQVKPTGTLNLCLNGHKITVKAGAGARHFYLEYDANLNLTNCNANKEGILTGGQSSSIMTSNDTKGGKVHTGEVNLYRIVMEGNTYSGGAAMMLQGNTKLTAVDSKIRNNTATSSAGAVRIYCSGAAVGVKATFDGCEIKNNTAPIFSAIRQEHGHVTLIDTVIEGNHATTAGDDSYGAVYFPNNDSKSLTVSGTTRIFGNTEGANKPANVLFQNAEGKQAVLTIGDGGLTGNAMIGITMRSDRLGAIDGSAFTAKLNGADVKKFFDSDKDGLEIVLKDDALHLEEESTHVHKLCNDSACTEHDDVKFKEWNDPNHLPTSGNYCLMTDVQLGTVVTINSELNLCLNGHTITAKKNERHFVVNGVLTITDCMGNGQVTGGKRTFGGACASVNAGGIFNLYGGQLTNNLATKNASGNAMGGAVFLYQASGAKPAAVFNMYGGKITGNSSEVEGGAIYGRAGSTINIYGGEISDNTATTNGGAIYGTGANIHISGGTISENTAERGSAMYANSGSKLNISGGIIENHTTGALRITGDSVINMTGGQIRNNKGSSGGALLMESRAKMTMSGGEFTGNTGTAGGAIFVSTNCTFEMTGGVISGNTATSTGGGLHLLRSNVTLAGGEIKDNTSKGNGGGVQIEGATVTLTGTKISGNAAINGAGMYIAGAKSGENVYQPVVSLAGGEISGNTASGNGGGVTNKDASFEKLELSGNIVINGNTAGGKTSNLYLNNEAVFTVGAMGDNAKVGVSALSVYGAVSAKTDKDCTAAFFSDNSALKVIYKDSTVYLQPADGHAHCLCNDKSTFCKDHGATVFAPWSDPKKLPSTPGNYYLTVDVQLGAVCNVFDDINLCLNGHTITPKKNERTFAVSPEATLSVTDCTDKGAITGGVRNYGGVINVNQGATFNLYGGNLTGNRTVKMDGEAGKAGAVYVTKASEDQPGGVFNMYGGSITENKTFWGGAVYVCDGAVMNLYGGIIANNKAMDRAGAICGDGKATINLYGGTITGNTAAKGGAIYVRNGSHINMAGAVITKNKTNATVWEEKQISKASGGAAIALTNQSTMTMSGGEISYNEGKGAGGAVIMESKDTKFTMTGGKFIGNTTISDGGAIYVSTNTVFEMSGGEIANNTAKKNGGGVYFLRSTGTITGGSINRNVTTEGAGAGVAMARATVTMKGGSVSYNVNKGAKSPKAGGIQMNGSTFNLYGGSIVGNYSVAKGSGMAITTSTASETKNGVKTTFYSKINMYGGTISGHTGSYGGAILLQSQTVMNMYGGTMRDNYAINEGGAVCLYSKSSFNMSGGSIVDNTSDDRGGGLKFNAGTTGTFTGGTVTGNYAAKYGGFFNAHGIDAKITMKDMKVYGNECKNYGGGIAITWNAILDMDDCEFYDNVGGEGGAMYLAHKTTCYLDNVKVYDNFSNDAGGGFYLDVGNNINFTNVKILDNESVGNGGAIYTRANLHLKDCLIDGNVSGKDGGAIATSAAWTYGNLPEHTNGYVGRGQGTIIENCKITNNTCVGRGGGAFMAKKNWNTIIDSEFSGNVSGETGSALFVGDDLKVVGMTVTGNTSKADGYAVYYRENTYDGQSYMQAIHEMGGNVIVKDNVGGDMMLCDKIAIGNIAEGYGEETYFNVTLSDGVLTNRILGEYNYEGGDLSYTVTYGSRSWTEPEVDTARIEANKPDNDNVWLYAGVGVFAATVIAVVVIILLKKKKAGKPAEVPQE